jgi:hypothetical protein
MKSNTIDVALTTGARSEQGRKQPNTYAYPELFLKHSKLFLEA